MTPPAGSSSGPATNAATHRSPMRGRFVPMALMVLFLGMVLGLMSIPFIGTKALPVLSASASLPFEGQAGPLVVEGRLNLAADGSTFTIRLRLAPVFRSVGSRPNLVLTMPDHAMPPLAPAVRSLGDGTFEASGFFPRGGRWEMRIETAEGQVAFPFFVE
jgi:hypothetical protein